MTRKRRDLRSSLRLLSRWGWRPYAVGALIIGCAAALWPLPANVRYGTKTSQVVLDRHGALLYESVASAEGYRRPTTLAEIAPETLAALIVTEDRTFYRHHGVRLESIARALYQNFTSGQTVSGGSTITQQLVRIRTGQRSGGLGRKIREAWYALKLEWIRSKAEILEAYLSEAYFGHGAYGLGSAADVYFGKRPLELTLGEQYLLIGLLQSPSRLDPYRAPVAAMARRERVLHGAVAAGIVDADVAAEAAAEPISLRSTPPVFRAPHFVLWMTDAVPQSDTIRTTLDAGLQTAVEEVVRHRLSQLVDQNVTSASVVVLDTRTGDILAMVGSQDFFASDIDGQVNRALALRQPGSTLKPFVYALALEQGDTLATTVADIETTFATKEGTPYIPRNYDYQEHGLVRYREALANSYNIAAVRVLERVGPERLLPFLRSAGLRSLTESPEHYGLALALGAGEVRLLELAQAYGVFARGGVTLHPRALADDAVATGERLLSAETAWLITSTLSDNAARTAQFGAESILKFDFPVAAKTGTSRNSRDNWVVGYTPDRIVAVWVGNANNEPMKGTSGVTGAGPIFREVMLLSTRQSPRRAPPEPVGLERRTICRLSGFLATPDCPEQMIEVFRPNTAPRQTDTVYQRIRIDPTNGLLVPVDCRLADTRQTVALELPLELRAWAREHGYPLVPDRVSPRCLGTTDLDRGVRLAITTPDPGDVFERDPTLPPSSERITFTGRAQGVETAEWHLNGKTIGTATAPDFRFSWPVQIGAWHLELVAGALRDERRFSVIDRRDQTLESAPDPK